MNYSLFRKAFTPTLRNLMMKVLIISLMLFIISCNEKEGRIHQNEQIQFPIKPDSVLEKKSQAGYLSYLKKDSSLAKKKVDLVYLKKEKSDTLIAFCNCEKNSEQNTLIIQPRIEFPSKSELKKGNKTSTYFFPGPPRQYRFPTIYLKDSIVQKIKILKASEETQFENKKIDSLSIRKYKILINTYDYKIAQNVWGTYELILPEEFGYSENDTMISGTFQCNNWKAVRYGKLNDWTEHQPFIE